MPVGSIIELYTTILAWTIYDSFYSILASTGLMLVPFIIMVIRTLLRSRDSLSESATAKGMVNSLTTQIYVGIVIILVAFMPTLYIYPEKTQYTTTQCTVTQAGNLNRTPVTKSFGDSDSSFDNNKGYFTAMIAGQGQPRIPLWWYIVHSISHAVAQAGKQELPCQADLRTMAAGLANLNVADKKLQSELQDFYRDCWQPAVNKFNREHPEIPSNAAYDDGKIYEDVAWGGSKFFIDMPGYYDTKRNVKGLDESLFPYKESRDSQILPPDANDGKGYPTCKEWWTDSDYGLRGRIVSDLKAGAGSADCTDCAGAWFKYWATNWFRDRTASDDALIKASLRSNNTDYKLAMNSASTPLDAGLSGRGLAQSVESLAGQVGLAFKTASKATETEAYRQAAPIVQAVFMLIFVAVLPVLLAISMYEIGNLMSLSIAMFTLIFWGFLFALASWIDNFLLEGLLSHGDAETNFLDLVMPEFNSMTTQITAWVGRATYVGIPLLFGTFMGIVGYAASGHLANIRSQHQDGAASAAGSGGGMAQNIVSGAVKAKAPKISK